MCRQTLFAFHLKNSDSRRIQLYPDLLFPLLLLLFSSSFHHGIHAARSSIRPGDSISINQTISSETFALGFFHPDMVPTSYYLGIWYKNLPGNKTVVWVANRESPLTDASGVLTLDADGNLVIRNGNRSMIWSSDSSAASSGTEAVLLDTGNLVLHLNGTTVWQSFDHPTDTVLPNMKLISDYKIGVSSRVKSWRAPNDPSPGNFSLGFDPRTSLQVFVWRGSEPYLRSSVWDGSTIGAQPLNNPFNTSIYVERFSVDQEKLSWWYTVSQDSAITRWVLEETGFAQIWSWEAERNRWVMIMSAPVIPARPCELYNPCGPNGVCNGTDSTRSCECLRGFVPKDVAEWDAGNFSGGCVREAEWHCSEGGHYVFYDRMKLPDRMIMIKDAGEKECEANCSADCNCTAYSFLDVESIGSKTRCLVWFGEMIDLVQNFTVNNELYVRTNASILDNTLPNEGSSRKLVHLLAVILPVGTILILLFLGAACYFRMRNDQLWKYKQKVTGVGGVKSHTISINARTIDVPLVDFCNILNATDNFAFTNKLGQGGFGSVYKGTLQDGQDIAVKRLSKNSTQGFDEFKNEVEVIAKLQHTNLVKLLGWCMHKNEKILIYEYLPNKSLDKYLFDSDITLKLDWDRRFQIIEGIAQGLLYLHRYSRLRVIHRDLKTSNILLDANMNPKISDFGLARIFGGNQLEAYTRRVVGTYGYMAPEYGLGGRFSEKSDVFSFGVIILEIISGKRNTSSFLDDDSLNLLGYAWQLWDQQRCSELVDPSMNSSFPASEVEKCIQVGLLCIQDWPSDRPTMDSIICMLGSDNPILPSPQPPAFTKERDASTVAAISCSPPSKKASYEMTMSTLGGR